MPQLGEIRSAKELERIGTYKYLWCACLDCQKERWVPIVRGKPNTKRCLKCEREARKGRALKNGRFISQSGYVSILLKPTDPFYSMANCNNYVLEHRLAMARHLGRCLKREEIIHHLNGIKKDNRKENLMLVNPNNHPRRTFIKGLQARIRCLEQLHLF